MNDMSCRETHGRNIPERSACGHDCGACLNDFEKTQQQVEQLRVDLLSETADHQQLWMEVRNAMRQTLADVIPARRVEGLPGETAEFQRGWEQCRQEIEARVQQLMRVI